MNKFTLSPHGEQYRLQHADANGNGTHIICTADELAQLRELLAPLAWQDKPTGAGKYVWVTESCDIRLTLIYKSVMNEKVIATWDDGDRYSYDLSGLWLKLPDVPSDKAA